MYVILCYLLVTLTLVSAYPVVISGVSGVSRLRLC